MEDKKTTRQTKAKGGKKPNAGSGAKPKSSNEETTLQKLKENLPVILVAAIFLVFSLFLLLSDGNLGLLGWLFFLLLFLL